MTEPTATVFEIVRGTTHDGPGMRTTIFLKGCPLYCSWCQNPEGIKPGQEIWWNEYKCIHCLACQQVCPVNAVIEDDKGLHIDPSKCTFCGACVEECPTRAMLYTGQDWTLDQLLEEALKDKDYYQAFGGGVTVSGGEPLMQSEFVMKFFKRLQENGINTALDTCGQAPEEALHSVLPYTDHVLYDIKIFDSALHKVYTGYTNKTIIENLIYIADYIRKVNQEKNRGKNQKMRLWIRTPLIFDITSTQENIDMIGRFISNNMLDVVERWELCAFNSACKSKYKKMNRIWEYEDYKLMTQNFIDTIKKYVLSAGIPSEKLVVSGLIAKSSQ